MAFCRPSSFIPIDFQGYLSYMVHLCRTTAYQDWSAVSYPAAVLYPMRQCIDIGQWSRASHVWSVREATQAPMVIELLQKVLVGFTGCSELLRVK